MKRFLLKPAFLFLFTSFVLSSAVFGQKLPKRELGLALGYAQIPYYPGSSATRKILIPMPLAIYRGDQDRLGSKHRLQWVLFSKKTKLAVSAGISLPVPANVSSIRQGLPALNATLELGPKVVVDLWKRQSQSLSFHLPVRAVSAISRDSASFQGVIFSPYLHYTFSGRKKNAWDVNISSGLQFGSQKYHAYFYDVPTSGATNIRPTFNAKAGYSGSRLTIYTQKSINRLWMSAFARLDYLGGAQFENSPLVEQKHSLIGGFVIGWIFARSSR